MANDRYPHSAITTPALTIGDLSPHRPLPEGPVLLVAPALQDRWLASGGPACSVPLGKRHHSSRPCSSRPPPQQRHSSSDMTCPPAAEQDRWLASGGPACSFPHGRSLHSSRPRSSRPQPQQQRSHSGMSLDETPGTSETPLPGQGSTREGQISITHSSGCYARAATGRLSQDGASTTGFAIAEEPAGSRHSLALRHSVASPAPSAVSLPSTPAAVGPIKYRQGTCSHPKSQQGSALSSNRPLASAAGGTQGPPGVQQGTSPGPPELPRPLAPAAGFRYSHRPCEPPSPDAQPVVHGTVPLGDDLLAPQAGKPIPAAAPCTNPLSTAGQQVFRPGASCPAESICLD